jgi:hypothetical protein
VVSKLLLLLLVLVVEATRRVRFVSFPVLVVMGSDGMDVSVSVSSLATSWTTSGGGDIVAFLVPLCMLGGMRRENVQEEYAFVDSGVVIFRYLWILYAVTWFEIVESTLLYFTLLYFYLRDLS